MTCKVLYYFIFITTIFLDKVILANVVVSSSTVPIVYCLDDKYVMPTIVSMESAVRNMNEDSFYKFILFVPNNFTQDSIGKFTIFQKKYSNKCDVTIMRMNDEYSKYDAKFYSLFIPDKLKDRFEKVIYIHGDTIIRGDLSELYKTEIGEAYFAGVCDCRVENNIDRVGQRVNQIVSKLPKKESKLNEAISKCQKYINSGVIIFNFSELKKCSTSLKEIFISISETGIPLSACDIINICYDSVDRKIIPLKYNIHLKNYGLDKGVESFMNREDIKFFKYNNDNGDERLKDELKDAKEKPVIVHFMGEHKPWNSRIGCMTAYYDEWLSIFNEIKIEYGFKDLKTKRKCCCGHIGLRS